MTGPLPPARYDEFAGWYAGRIAGGTWVDATILDQLESMTGPVTGQNVLDCCCGEGMLAFHMASLGARVTGVDLSERLLEIAQRREGTPRPAFLHDDARTLDSIADDAFDGATCFMALMDIPDLAAVYRSLRRVVQPGGWFVAVITHPCFESPHAAWLDDGSRTANRYLTEGEWFSRGAEGVRSRVGAHHRTLSTVLNEAIAAGWTLDHLREPQHIQHDNPNPDIPRLLFLRFR
jgi:SAM-dependent methyltransferase